MYENKKALIVDDEEKARLYLASILAELHPEIEIQLVSTPTEALFLLKKQHFDIIFLDVEMPGMSGLEMLEQLHEILRYTPFIFVSSYKRAEFIQKALRLNAVDYIDKPVNPTELDNAVRKAFENNIKTVDRNNHHKSAKFCLMTDVDERLVESNEIIYFQSLKRYATAYFIDGSKRVVRYNISHLNQLLPSSCFIKVSRKHIINLKYLKSIYKSNKTIILKFAENEIKLDKITPEVINELINNHSLSN
jgi:two-component system LytT family response regulator